MKLYIYHNHKRRERKCSGWFGLLFSPKASLLIRWQRQCPDPSLVQYTPPARTLCTRRSSIKGGVTWRDPDFPWKQPIKHFTVFDIYRLPEMSLSIAKSWNIKDEKKKILLTYSVNCNFYFVFYFVFTLFFSFKFFIFLHIRLTSLKTPINFSC